MRCPKCGYISFDHLEICLNCHKDVSKVSTEVEGTTYHAVAPSFLRFQSTTTETLSEDDVGIHFDNDQDDYAMVDPDLEVLVNDDDPGMSFDDGLGSLADEDDFEVTLTDDNDSDDIGIDLGQFEEAFDGKSDAILDDEVALDFPDELSDISDLSPPGGASPSPAVLGEEIGLDDFSLNLDLDDFSLSSTDDSGSSGSDDMDLGGLSLDDIGLSDSPKTTAKKQAPSKNSMDMDGDLDFDLDLGGL